MTGPHVSQPEPRIVRLGRPRREDREAGGLAVGRVTRGVAAALGRTLQVDREAILPEPLAALVERLHSGPLGQPSLNSRRVA